MSCIPPLRMAWCAKRFANSCMIHSISRSLSTFCQSTFIEVILDESFELRVRIFTQKCLEPHAIERREVYVGENIEEKARTVLVEIQGIQQRFFGRGERDACAHFKSEIKAFADSEITD